MNDSENAKTFKARNFLDLKARGTFTPLKDALALADRVIREHKGGFLEAAARDLKRLAELGGRLVPDTDRSEVIAEIRHIADDLREQGGMFDYPLVTEVANGLYVFLERRERLGDKEIDLVAVYIDSLLLLFHREAEGRHTDEGRAIIAALREVEARLGGGKEGA